MIMKRYMIPYIKNDNKEFLHNNDLSHRFYIKQLASFIIFISLSAYSMLASVYKGFCIKIQM